RQRNRSSVLLAAWPPGGTPQISLRPPKALVVVDSRQSGPPSCTLQVCNCVGRSRVEHSKSGKISRRPQYPVRAEVPETTRLPPSKDTDLGLGPKTCGQLLPKWPVENP